MIHEFASFVISSGWHGPGSMPPSTVGSRTTTFPPSTRAVRLLSEVASAAT